MSCLGEMFMCLKSGQLHPVAHGTVSFLQEQFTDITGCFNVCSRSQLKQTNKQKNPYFLFCGCGMSEHSDVKVFHGERKANHSSLA